MNLKDDDPCRAVALVVESDAPDAADASDAPLDLARRSGGAEPGADSPDPLSEDAAEPDADAPEG